MSNRYFSQFPYLTYTLNGSDEITTDVVTNIFRRVALRTSMRDSTALFYDYLIKEGETPDILADRIYGSSDLYWVILFANIDTMLDPQLDWPYGAQQFERVLIEKYTTVSLANSTPHHYTKTLLRENSAGETSTATVEIDLTEYGTLASVIPVVYTHADGTWVRLTTSRETISSYTYESERNESRRSIKLLRPIYLSMVKDEMNTLAS